MKILTRALLFSTFIILALAQDPCAEAYKYAEESLGQLKTNFYDNNFDLTIQDLSSLKVSMENIQKTCQNTINKRSHSTGHMPCSFIRIQIMSILESFDWEKMSGSTSRGDLTSALHGILMFLPMIESQECIDEWIFTKNANGVLNQDVMWVGDLNHMGQVENDSEFTYTNINEVEQENSDSTDGLSELYTEAPATENFKQIHVFPYFDIETELSLNQNAEEINVLTPLQEALANTPEEREKQDDLISALFALDFDVNQLDDAMPSDTEPTTDEEDLD